MKISKNLSESFKKIYKSKLFLYTLLAQLLALALFGNGVAADALSTAHNINIPCFLSFILYFMLSIIFVPIALKKYEFILEFKKKWWKFLIIAICDFEATYLIVKSYQYTNYASIQFIDCLVIPFSLILSIFILKRKFYIFHYIGSFVSIIGVVCFVLANIRGKISGLLEGDNILKGDLMCSFACLLYALSNVLTELFLKDSPCIEFLAFLSLFAIPISLIQ
ncbi:hypothetical protein HZS_2866, partial [Henneguya salminicola]